MTRKAIPDTGAGFTAMHRSAMAKGALPTRVKELMALVVGGRDLVAMCPALDCLVRVRREFGHQEPSTGIGAVHIGARQDGVALSRSGGRR